MACQVGKVAKINPSTSLMVSFSFNVVAFIPSQVFRFGSLDFVASEDGRLCISNLEATRSREIGFDPVDHKIDFSSQDMTRFEEDQDIIPSFLVGLENTSDVCQKAIQQDYALRYGYILLSSSKSDMIQSEEGRTIPSSFPFGLRNSSATYQHVLVGCEILTGIRGALG